MPKKFEASSKLVRDIDMEDTEIEKIADAIYRAYGSDTHYLFGIPPEHEKVVRSIIKLAITKYKEVCLKK